MPDATTKPEKDTQHVRCMCSIMLQSILYYLPITTTLDALSTSEKEPTNTINSDSNSSSHSPPSQHETDLSTYLLVFIVDTLPRQIYLHLLLRLPYLYFSRVTRIFEDAEMSMPEIKKMALEVSAKSKDPALFHRLDTLILRSSPQYVDLQRSWETFVDSLLREWKTLNIISVLLLS